MFWNKKHRSKPAKGTDGLKSLYVRTARRTLSEPGRARLLAEIAKLLPSEQDVLASRFGLGRNKESVEEIAHRLEVRTSAVRRYEGRALQKLRTALQIPLADEAAEEELMHA